MQQKKRKKKIEKQLYNIYFFDCYVNIRVYNVNKQEIFSTFSIQPPLPCLLNSPFEKFLDPQLHMICPPKKAKVANCTSEDRFLLNAANFLELNFSRIYREIVLAAVRPNIHLRNCKWLSCKMYNYI